MDYEAVRVGLEQAIPFNRHLGLEVLEVSDGRGVVLLPEGDNPMNHVGSQHAGGLFTAGAWSSPSRWSSPMRQGPPWPA
jgi:acyl-coenzyme A thioesterase PaaI-like protein